MKPFSGCFLGFQFKTAGYHLNYQSQDKKGKFEERSIGFEERSNDFAGYSNDFAGYSNDFAVCEALNLGGSIFPCYHS
jgi:hypothetical protein